MMLGPNQVEESALVKARHQLLLTTVLGPERNVHSDSPQKKKCIFRSKLVCRMQATVCSQVTNVLVAASDAACPTKGELEFLSFRNSQGAARSFTLTSRPQKVACLLSSLLFSPLIHYLSL